MGNTFTQASSAIFSRHARDGNLNGTFKLPLLVCQMRTYILRDDIQFDKKKCRGILTFGAGVFLLRDELRTRSECLCPHNQMLDFVLKLGINTKVTSMALRGKGRQLTFPRKRKNYEQHHFVISAY